MARWKKGQSGNPAGRPKGAGEVMQLRAKLKPHLDDVLAALVERAQAGDVAAIKLILERAIPPHKPTTEPVCIPGLASAETLTDRAHIILDAIASGSIAPDLGAGLLSALGHVAKAAEIDELTRRIEALEHESQITH